MKIIDGKKINEKVLSEVKKEVNTLNKKGVYPTLAVILASSDPASKVYVKNKSLACKRVGIKCKEFIFDETVTQKDLENLIDTLNDDKSIHGILLQSPVADKIDINSLFNRINPLKDVDGFNPVNYGNLLIGKDTLTSCTSLGIIRLLEEYNIEIKSKHAVIIGRSNIVSKPLSLCLLNKDATVTICHSKTKNLESITKTADILISAVGKANFVTANMVKNGACVIDVGINRNENNKLCGDVDFEAVKEKCSFITKVPGGVGPMTVAYLMKNVIKAVNLQI